MPLTSPAREGVIFAVCFWVALIGAVGAVGAMLGYSLAYVAKHGF